MGNIHTHERRQFEKLFDQEEIDCLQQRLAILDAFLQTEQHVTADELTDILKKQGQGFEKPFVEETLELMRRYGFAQKNRFENGQARYEHRHLGDHHDHMICTKCNRIIEFEDSRLENLQQEIARSYGFHMLQHRMEIYGICDRCLKDRMKKMPLTAAKIGERVVIRELTGGSSSRLRLMSMGLRVNDELEVITNYGQGQMVVAAGNQRYVLGRGLARKIIVEPYSQASPSGSKDSAP
ncbi:MAG: transcriptional repressor [Desulfobacterales bacterium]|nr:transcriptional repressor [Desulfobacterales bacterium]MBS3755648.1 transcriptional repressor [Desulfobacterales bacterium]